MPINDSNLENVPFLTPKGHPRVCWVICIILQLHHNEIGNTMINTIDAIDTTDRINFIDQYEGNRYDRYNQLKL